MRMRWSASEVDGMPAADIVQWINQVVEIDREVNEAGERR